MCYPFIRLGNKINWRAGRPYRCTGISIEPFRHRLKPGMVILVHKDYELTNFFIKGYWTHAGFVISDEFIVEAISKGVIKKSLDEFISRVDDFIILEPGFCDFTVMEKASEYVQMVIGYPYNFTFRSRYDSYYCSELVYRAYAHSDDRQSQHDNSRPAIREMRSGKILKPQGLLESRPDWQVVDFNRPIPQS
jgi:hypothetical protein